MKYKFRLLRGRHVDESGTYVQDQTLESDIELDKKFGSDKFLRLQADQAVVETLTDGLDNMTVVELRKYAQEEEIDINNCRTKAEILTAIRSTIEE